MAVHAKVNKYATEVFHVTSTTYFITHFQLLYTVRLHV